MRKLILACLLAIAPATVWAADTTVTQSHTTFDVDEVTLKKGDTLTFKNADDVTHNIQVTNDDGDTDDKGLQKPGEDIKEKFSSPGKYKVHCAIHPRMKMTVAVQ